MSEVKNAIFNYWGNYFNCNPSLLDSKGTIFTYPEKLLNTNKIVFWEGNKRTVVQADLSLKEKLKFDISQNNVQISVRRFIEDSGLNDDLSKGFDFYFYLDPADFNPVNPPKGYIIRKLTKSDMEIMKDFENSCTRNDWKAGFVRLEHEVAYGMLHNEKLIAVTSILNFGILADIGIITRQDYRRKGLARAVVSEVCRWGVENKRIMQYRFNVNNQSSGNIARALGFKSYFKCYDLVLR